MKSNARKGQMLFLGPFLNKSNHQSVIFSFLFLLTLLVLLTCSIWEEFNAWIAHSRLAELSRMAPQSLFPHSPFPLQNDEVKRLRSINQEANSRSVELKNHLDEKEMQLKSMHSDNVRRTSLAGTTPCALSPSRLFAPTGVLAE